MCLESTWSYDGEHTDHVGLESERVRDVARQEDECPGTSTLGLVADVAGDLAFEHVEALVVPVVDVARRLETLAPPSLPGARYCVAPSGSTAFSGSVVMRVLLSPIGRECPLSLSALVRLPVYKQ